MLKFQSTTLYIKYLSYGEFKNSTAVLLNDYNDTSIFTNLTNTIIFIDQSMTIVISSSTNHKCYKSK